MVSHRECPQGLGHLTWILWPSCGVRTKPVYSGAGESDLNWVSLFGYFVLVVVEARPVNHRDICQGIGQAPMAPGKTFGPPGGMFMGT